MKNISITIALAILFTITGALSPCFATEDGGQQSIVDMLQAIKDNLGIVDEGETVFSLDPPDWPHPEICSSFSAITEAMDEALGLFDKSDSIVSNDFLRAMNDRLVCMELYKDKNGLTAGMLQSLFEKASAVKGLDPFAQYLLQKRVELFVSSVALGELWLSRIKVEKLAGIIKLLDTPIRLEQDVAVLDAARDTGIAESECYSYSQSPDFLIKCYVEKRFKQSRPDWNFSIEDDAANADYYEFFNFEIYDIAKMYEEDELDTADAFVLLAQHATCKSMLINHYNLLSGLEEEYYPDSIDSMGHKLIDYVEAGGSTESLKFPYRKDYILGTEFDETFDIWPYALREAREKNSNYLICEKYVLTNYFRHSDFWSNYDK